MKARRTRRRRGGSTSSKQARKAAFLGAVDQTAQHAWILIDGFGHFDTRDLTSLPAGNVQRAIAHEAH